MVRCKLILPTLIAVVMVVAAATVAFATVRETHSGLRELPVVIDPIIDPCDFGIPPCPVWA